MIRITGGNLKGRTIKSVPDKRTRYTSSILRQAIFSIVNVEGRSFLDLFCGSCSVLIEALSRGATFGAGVDISPKAIKTCRENLKRLGLEGLSILYKADATRFVRSKGEAFDVIFMDPPYELGLVDRTLKNMREDILSEGGILILEASKREYFDIPKFLRIVRSREYGDSKLVVLKKV